MSDVIQIGDWQIQRKHALRMSQAGECDHKHLELDGRGDIVRCSKCGIQVSAFWALEMLADEYNRRLAKLERDREALAKAKEAEVHLLAARKVDKIWRSRTMVPACPHCHQGILPEDGLGNSRMSREIELRRRAVALEANRDSGLSE